MKFDHTRKVAGSADGRKGDHTMIVKACECEHAAHFEDEQARTPNGNPGHKYGVRFAPRAMHVAKTTGGTFTVCRDCFTDCIDTSVFIEEVK
jgi:hypothetical protein